MGERRLPHREHECRPRLQQGGRRGHCLTRRGRSVEGDKSWTVVRVHEARIFELGVPEWGRAQQCLRGTLSPSGMHCLTFFGVPLGGIFQESTWVL